MKRYMVLLLCCIFLAACGGEPVSSAPAASSAPAPPPPGTSTPVVEEAENGRVVHENETDYMSLILPDDWAYEKTELCALPTADAPDGRAQHDTTIAFWPAADPDCAAKLTVHPAPIAICGTGVTFEDRSFALSGEASVAYEDIGDSRWHMIFFEADGGRYTVEWSPTTAQRTAYEDTFWQIMNTIIIGMDVQNPAERPVVVHEDDTSRMTVTLPEGWSARIAPEDELSGTNMCGQIIFWPDDDPTCYALFHALSDSYFLDCAVGVKLEERTFAEAGPAVMQTVEPENPYYLIHFSEEDGRYLVMWDPTAEQYEKYGDDFWQMMETVTIGK